MTERCQWAVKDPLMRAYHDAEWGVPERDSRALWEKLMLDGFQAGLAWVIILRKRDAFRAAFAGFDPEKVARFDAEDVERLMGDAGIGHARAYLAMQDAGEDFSDFVWGMAGGAPILGDGVTFPTKTDLSEAMSKA